MMKIFFMRNGSLIEHGDIDSLIISEDDNIKGSDVLGLLQQNYTKGHDNAKDNSQPPPPPTPPPVEDMEVTMNILGYGNVLVRYKKQGDRTFNHTFMLGGKTIPLTMTAIERIRESANKLEGFLK